MTIVTYLAEIPDHLPLVASWVYGQWGHYDADLDQTKVEKRYRRRLQRDKIPLCLVALADDVPVGTASIVHDDMPIRPQYTPWMASVYVAADQREQGIGSELVRAIEAEASNLGIKTLYLYTPDRETFYARLGWQVVEWLEYHDEQVVVMRKQIG